MRCVSVVAAALLSNSGALGSDYSQYMSQYAGGQGDYSKYMQGYGGGSSDYSKYMQGFSQGQSSGDYSKYMQQYGNYSKYMGSQGQSSGDYSKYMQQYGDYSKYMQGSSGGGSSDYMKYMSQYAGLSGANGTSMASVASSNHTSGAEVVEQSGFQSYMGEYLPPGDGGYVDRWTGSWSNQTASFEEIHSTGENGYSSYVNRYSSMAGKHPSSGENWQGKSAEQQDAFHTAVGDSIGNGDWTGGLNRTTDNELAEARRTSSSFGGLLTMAVAGVSLPVALAFVHRARKARSIAAAEATQILLAEHVVDVV